MTLRLSYRRGHLQRPLRSWLASSIDFCNQAYLPSTPFLHFHDHNRSIILANFSTAPNSPSTRPNFSYDFQHWVRCTHDIYGVDILANLRSKNLV